MKQLPVIVLLSALMACTADQTRPPRYVWYCHIAGGAGCTGEMIRCWDSQSRGWTEDTRCAAVVTKPDSLVNNQSWPAVSDSALYPGAR